MSINALPCIVCGEDLKNVFEDAMNQPNNGVACVTEGNYGSTVFDPIATGEFLEFNVCDTCLVRAGQQGRIYTARRARPVFMEPYGLIGWIRAPYTPVLWHKGLPGMDDDIHVDSLEEFNSLGHGATLLEGVEDLIK